MRKNSMSRRHFLLKTDLFINKTIISMAFFNYLDINALTPKEQGNQH